MKFFQEQSSVTDLTTEFILPDILQVGTETAERENSFTRVHRDFALYKNLVKQFFSSGKKMESYEVKDWFNLNQSNIPTISYFASIIHSIPPSQIENERDFSLAGVIARARRATLTVENLAMLVFINKNNKYKSNKIDTSNKVKNIFEDSFYDVQEKIDDVEAFLKENGEDLM